MAKNPETKHSLKSEQRYKELSDSEKLSGLGNIPLWQHAEMWYYEQGNNIPERDTDAWQQMYEQWIDFAFAGFKRVED